MTRSAQRATIARPCGAARRDWRKAQQSLDLRFAHECYHYLDVRLPDAIGAGRNDRWTSRFGTQIVAALRLRFRLRKRDIVPKYARPKCAAGSMTLAIFKHFLTKLPTHLYFDLHFCKVF